MPRDLRATRLQELAGSDQHTEAHDFEPARAARDSHDVPAGRVLRPRRRRRHVRTCRSGHSRPRKAARSWQRDIFVSPLPPERGGNFRRLFIQLRFPAYIAAGLISRSWGVETPYLGGSCAAVISTPRPCGRGGVSVCPGAKALKTGAASPR